MGRTEGEGGIYQICNEMHIIVHVCVNVCPSFLSKSQTRAPSSMPLFLEQFFHLFALVFEGPEGLPEELFAGESPGGLNGKDKVSSVASQGDGRDGEGRGGAHALAAHGALTRSLEELGWKQKRNLG